MVRLVAVESPLAVEPAVEAKDRRPVAARILTRDENALFALHTTFTQQPIQYLKIAVVRTIRRFRYAQERIASTQEFTRLSDVVGIDAALQAKPNQT